MNTFCYTGVDPQHRTVSGRLDAATPADAVKRLFDDGLQVAQLSTEGGAVIGQVTRDLNGKRTWWADKPTLTELQKHKRDRNRRRR